MLVIVSGYAEPPGQVYYGYHYFIPDLCTTLGFGYFLRGTITSTRAKVAAVPATLARVDVFSQREKRRVPAIEQKAIGKK